MEIKSVHIEIFNGGNDGFTVFQTKRKDYDFGKLQFGTPAVAADTFVRETIKAFVQPRDPKGAHIYESRITDTAFCRENETMDELCFGRYFSIKDPALGVTQPKQPFVFTNTKLYRTGKFLRLWKKLIAPSERVTKTVSSQSVTGSMFCVYVETDEADLEFYGVTQAKERIPTKPWYVLEWLKTYNPISMRVKPRDGSPVLTYRSIGDGSHCIDFSQPDHYDALRKFLTVQTYGIGAITTDKLASEWDDFCMTTSFAPKAFKITINDDLKLHQGILNHIRRVVLADPYRADRPVGFLWRKLIPNFNWDDFFFDALIETKE